MFISHFRLEFPAAHESQIQKTWYVAPLSCVTEFLCVLQLFDKPKACVKTASLLCILIGSPCLPASVFRSIFDFFFIISKFFRCPLRIFLQRCLDSIFLAFRVSHEWFCIFFYLFFLGWILLFDWFGMCLFCSTLSWAASLSLFHFCLIQKFKIFH